MSSPRGVNVSEQVLFFADFGPRSGWGHIKRTLALANAIVMKGPFTVSFAVPRDRGPGPTELEGFSRVKVEGASDEEILGEIEAMVERRRFGAVFVDSYRLTGDQIRGLARASKVVVITDVPPRRLDCDVLINPSADADDRRLDLVRADTRVLLGPQFALLGNEYWHAAPRSIGDVVTNVLVSLGAAKVTESLVRLVAGISQIEGSFALTVIPSPYEDRRDLLRRLGGVFPNTRLHVAESSRSLLELISGADAAISAAGQTIYELAALGVPTVVIPLNPIQRSHAEALSALGAVRSARADPEQDLAGALEPLEEILADPIRRKSLARRATAVVNKRGALEAADNVLPRLWEAPQSSAPYGAPRD